MDTVDRPVETAVMVGLQAEVVAEAVDLQVVMVPLEWEVAAVPLLLEDLLLLVLLRTIAVALVHRLAAVAEAVVPEVVAQAGSRRISTIMEHPSYLS